MTTSVPVNRSTATTGPLRRVPVQDRSVARVQRMLDACASIMDEVGYEGLTTTLLAERAGVAIGSVYQFFPDKRAVVQALTQRNLQALQERLADRLGDGGDLAGWWEGVDAALAVYVDMHRDVPGFRALRLGDLVRVADDAPDHNAVISAQLAGVLTNQPDVPDTPRVRLALAVAMEATDALVKLAFRRDPRGDEQVLGEARALIREYLHRYLTAAGYDRG